MTFRVTSSSLSAPPPPSREPPASLPPPRRSAPTDATLADRRALCGRCRAYLADIDWCANPACGCARLNRRSPWLNGVLWRSSTCGAFRVS